MITQLARNEKFLDDNVNLTPRSWRWTNDVTKLSIFTGSGSPEGVIAAEITRQYMDTSGATGSILYIKRDADIAGDRKKGWILV